MTYTVRAIVTGVVVGKHRLAFQADSAVNRLTALHDMSLAVGEHVYDIGSPDNTYQYTQYYWDTTFDFSDGVSYTVRIGPTPPDAPGAPSLTARQGGIVMSWSAPANAGSGRIIRYDIRWTERGAGWDSGTQHSFFGPNLHHTIWGLSGDTEYEVQVRAVNEFVETNEGIDRHFQFASSWSPSGYATVPPAPPTPEVTPTPESVYGSDGEPLGKADFEDCENFESCNNDDDPNADPDPGTLFPDTGDYGENRGYPPMLTATVTAITATSPPSDGVKSAKFRIRPGGGSWAEHTATIDNSTTGVWAATIGGLSPDTVHEVQVREFIDGSWAAWSQSAFIKTKSKYECFGQFPDSCDYYNPPDDPEPQTFYDLDNPSDTSPPRHPSAPPLSDYDSNGEPKGKKNFKECTNGDPCND